MILNQLGSIKMSQNLSLKDFVPKRYGLQYSPPAIILEYYVPSKKKLYHHKMDMRDLDPDHDPADWLDYLRQNHGLYVHQSVVDEEQILNLIEHLQSQLMTDEIDYNNLSPEEIEEYRRQMNEMYRQEQESGKKRFYDQPENYSSDERDSDIDGDLSL